MNPYPADHPDLTRFALDELPTADTPAFRSTVEQNPTLQAEVTAIQDLAHQLRAQAPLHDLRLTSQQRQQILQGPISKPIAPRPRPVTSPSPVGRSFGTYLISISRIAALVALVCSAYWLGFSSKSNTPPQLITVTLPAPAAAPASERISHAHPPSPTPLTAVPGPSVTDSPAAVPAPLATETLAATAKPAIEPSKPAEKALVTQKATATPAKPEPRKPATANPAQTLSALASHLGITEPAISLEFLNASRRAADSLELHPKRIRPATSAPANSLQAKPLSPNTKTETPQPAARNRPDLFVHAWRSDIASCPWNPTHRLLRITVQLPSDQESAQIGDHSYPLDIAFDPNNVREYRRLCSRHYPSPEAGHAGKIVVWYEFKPNGSAAESHDNGKHIASVRLTSARFTTQTIGPFDASQIQVLDRGKTWQQAREDFVFESAQVGLQLLLDGAPQNGALNHALVLQLAEHAAPTRGADRGHAHFIKTLRDLRKLTGP